MSAISSVLGVFGVGENPTYGFAQQQKDFIKLQFKYGLILHRRLQAGTVSQAYYDANFWLTTETLDPPYAGWWDEFKSAIQAEDLAWLAKQVGETTDQLVDYLGDALAATAGFAGKIVSKSISGVSTGLVSGFFGGLNPVGWVVVVGLGFGLYWSFKHGYAQRTIKSVFDVATIV
jgi:hypothetical protein